MDIADFDIKTRKDEAEFDWNVWKKGHTTLPPAVEHGTMRQDDEESEDLAELDELEQEVRSKGGSASAAQDKSFKTETSQSTEDEPQTSDGAGVPLSRMSGISAKYIPQIYEIGVQQGTTFAYTQSYAKKLKEILATHKNVLEALKTSSALKEEQRATLNDFEVKLRTILSYHAERLAGIKAAVAIPEDAKALATEIISEMMAASGKEISPMAALMGIAMMPVIAAVGYVGKDVTAYNMNKLTQ